VISVSHGSCFRRSRTFRRSFDRINPLAYPMPALSPDLFARLLSRQRSSFWQRSRRRPMVRHPRPMWSWHQAAELAVACFCVGTKRSGLRAGTDLCRARARWEAGRHQVLETDAIAALRGSRLAVVVNPNNPDGSLQQREALLSLADDQRINMVSSWSTRRSWTWGRRA